jgi:hypothetical protein
MDTADLVCIGPKQNSIQIFLMTLLAWVWVEVTICTALTLSKKDKLFTSTMFLLQQQIIYVKIQKGLSHNTAICRGSFELYHENNLKRQPSYK